MKILLTVMVIILILPIIGFVLSLFMGASYAAINSEKKRKRAQSIVLLSRLPQETHASIKEIWQAFKVSNTPKVNALVDAMEQDVLKETLDVLKLANKQVPPSSRWATNTTSWVALKAELNSRGYSNDAGEIITSIIAQELYRVL